MVNLPLKYRNYKKSFHILLVHRSDDEMMGSSVSSCYTSHNMMDIYCNRLVYRYTTPTPPVG